MLKKNQVKLSSIFVSIFFVLSLSISDGYSIGAALISLAGLVLFLKNLFLGRSNVLASDDMKLGVVFLLSSFIIIYSAIGSDDFLKNLDDALKYILACFGLYYLILNPVKISVLWLSIGVGSVLAGFTAMYQIYFLDFARATGYMPTIQFGNISLVFAVLSLVGAYWFKKTSTCRKDLYYFLFLISAFILGIYASILSGSRGGWVAIPIVALFLVKTLSPKTSFNKLFIVMSVILSLMTLVYYSSFGNVNQRVDLAVSEVKDYINTGDAHSSVGARLEMWKNAVVVGLEHPFLGNGRDGYIAKKQEMIDEGLTSDSILNFAHPHNEVLNAFVKYGLLGVIALLLLYYIPFSIFMRHYRSLDYGSLSIAVGGGATCILYFDFGLTESFFSTNSGLIVYLFTVVILYSSLRELKLKLRV